jgi:hypothetical protein
MSTAGNWRGSDIVKNGLVLYLDPGSPNSYFDKNSTNIKDISGNNYSGSLVNGPIYSSANGGTMVVDGTNDYLITQTIASYKTLCFWINWTDTALTFEYLLDARPAMAGGWFIPSAASQGSDWNSTFYVNGVVKTGCNVTNVPPNVWLYICLQGVNSSYTSTINFMSRFTNNENAVGTIGSIQIYNRALTQQEVLQNFNAQRSRYGI